MGRVSDTLITIAEMRLEGHRSDYISNRLGVPKSWTEGIAVNDQMKTLINIKKESN